MPLTTENTCHATNNRLNSHYLGNVHEKKMHWSFDMDLVHTRRETREYTTLLTSTRYGQN